MTVPRSRSHRIVPHLCPCAKPSRAYRAHEAKRLNRRTFSSVDAAAANCGLPKAQAPASAMRRHARQMPSPAHQISDSAAKFAAHSAARSPGAARQKIAANNLAAYKKAPRPQFSALRNPLPRQARELAEIAAVHACRWNAAARAAGFASYSPQYHQIWPVWPGADTFSTSSSTMEVPHGSKKLPYSRCACCGPCWAFRRAAIPHGAAERSAQ